VAPGASSATWSSGKASALARSVRPRPGVIGRMKISNPSPNCAAS
jgi:hypothetical protein